MPVSFLPPSSRSPCVPLRVAFVLREQGWIPQALQDSCLNRSLESEEETLGKPSLLTLGPALDYPAAHINDDCRDRKEGLGPLARRVNSRQQRSGSQPPPPSIACRQSATQVVASLGGGVALWFPCPRTHLSLSLSPGSQLSSFPVEKALEEAGKPSCSSGFLPGRLRFLCWLVLGTVGLASGFFTVLYSLQLSRAQATHWATTMVLSVLQGVFLMQPLKVRRKLYGGGGRDAVLPQPRPASSCRCWPWP